MKCNSWIRGFISMVLILSLCLGMGSALAEDALLDAHAHTLAALQQAPAGDMAAEIKADLNNRRAEMLLDGLSKDVGDHSYKEKEPNNFSYQANIIRHDYTVSGTLSSSDLLDYFTFTLNSRSKVIIIAATSYRSFMMGVWNSKDECIGAATNGKYSNGSYVFDLSGTLSAGTYDLCLLDSNKSYNSYLFYISIEPVSSSCSHTSYTTQKVAATCTDQGYTLNSCKNCSYTWKTNYVDALGHKEVVTSGYAATCTQPGMTDGKHCSRCNTVIQAQETIPALGHTEATIDALAPTCTMAGNTEGSYCRVCGEIFVTANTIPATGHTEAILEGVPATCTTVGLSDGVYCSVCNETLTKQIVLPKHSQAIVVDPAVEVTCTTDGYTEGKHCTDCGAVLATQQRIPATGHKEVVTPATNPTCTTDGNTRGVHCATCGEVLVVSEVLPATGHTLVFNKTDFTLTEGDAIVLSDFAEGCQHLQNFTLSGRATDESKLTVAGNAIHALDTGSASMHLIVAMPGNQTKNVVITAIIHAAETAVLPADLITIGEEAFAESAIEEFILQEGITSIGSLAFADSSVKMIHIPATVTYIAPDAFDGCGEVFIFATPGSAAESFAEMNGFPFVV